MALIGEEKANQLAALVGEISCGPRTEVLNTPKPEWARDYQDKRHVLRWDRT